MDKNAGAVNCRFQRKNRGLGGIAQARLPGVLRTRKIAFNLGTRQLRSMLILGEPVFHDYTRKMHVFNVPSCLMSAIGVLDAISRVLRGPP